MKRKMIVTIVAAAALSLTACGSAVPDAVSEEITEETQEDGSDEAEATVDEAKEETVDEANAETAEETVVEEESNLPDEEAIRVALDATINWMGEQFVYEPAIDHSSLTVQEAVPMATFAQFEEKSDYDHDDQWRMLIPISDVENKMTELFGQVYPVAEYDIDKDINSLIEVQDDVIALTLGDWGISYPQYDINTIDDTGDGAFVVNVRYYLYDDENEVEVEGFGYNATFYCKIDENSKNGFVITDMSAKHMN